MIDIAIPCTFHAAVNGRFFCWPCEIRQRRAPRFWITGFSGVDKNPAGSLLPKSKHRLGKITQVVQFPWPLTYTSYPARSSITLSPSRRGARVYRTQPVEKKITHDSCENNIRFGFLSPPLLYTHHYTLLSCLGIYDVRHINYFVSHRTRVRWLFCSDMGGKRIACSGYAYGEVYAYIKLHDSCTGKTYGGEKIVSTVCCVENLMKVILVSDVQTFSDLTKLRLWINLVIYILCMVYTY